MTISSINGQAFSALSAVKGITLASLSAVNGQTIAAGSFPTTGILDDFNRTNANPLDGDWTQGFQGTFDGDLQVLSNACAWASGGLSDSGTATWDTAFNANQEAYMTIVTRVDGSQHTLICRANNAGASNVTGYEIVARTNNSDVRVIQWDSDVSAAVLDTFSQTISDGDTFGVSLSGTVGTVYYKVGAGAWGSIGTFDASAYNASGKIGISLFLNGTVCDDFGGGNI